MQHIYTSNPWFRASRRWARFLPLLALSSCKMAVLAPSGPIGIADRTILIDSLAIMLAIVVPTMVAVLAFAWWFRASNTRARYRPDWAFSGQVELITWAVPAMTILLLGGVTWISSHSLDPAESPRPEVKPLEIQVVSLDWKWLFIYPDQHIATVNDLVVPSGLPLHFTLTSGSVMSAFFVPQLGSMIYTMNGMATQLYLEADKPGDYRGMASHFSGDGFPGMHFMVHAVPQAQFAAWVSETYGKGPALTDAAYRDLSRQSSNVPKSSYGSVQDGLFAGVVKGQLPPGPGPEEGSNSEIRPEPVTQQRTK